MLVAGGCRSLVGLRWWQVVAVVEIRWGPAMVDVAAYMGAGAVLPLEDDVGRKQVYDVPLMSTDKPVFKSKESRRRRLARHGQWLWSGGRYLEP